MVLWKATVLLVAGGLTGSGIIAFTRPDAPPQQAAIIQAAAASGEPANHVFQQGYVQARFAAQRPFATLNRVSR